MLDAETFVDLLRAAQRGDETAFTALFRDTQPVLLRYLRVIDARLADDVAADTWVSVVRDLENFSGPDTGSFRGWVLQIARRRWIDELRRAGRRPESPTAELPEQASGDDVATAVADNDAAARIVALVKQLPPDQAEVVALRVILGLDVPATAALVGKTTGAVRVLSHRGLRRLAELYAADPSNAAVAPDDLRAT
jgi:RNA polymerase sigma-70 factor (ECF subfamily)